MNILIIVRNVQLPAFCRCTRLWADKKKQWWMKATAFKFKLINGGFSLQWKYLRGSDVCADQPGHVSLSNAFSLLSKLPHMDGHYSSQKEISFSWSSRPLQFWTAFSPFYLSSSKLKVYLCSCCHTKTSINPWMISLPFLEPTPK